MQIVVLGVLFTAPGWLSVLGFDRRSPEPTGAQSQMIGWQDPATTDHIAPDLFERVNLERHARGLRRSSGMRVLRGWLGRGRCG